jgi:hypothetical protein
MQPYLTCQYQTQNDAMEKKLDLCVFDILTIFYSSGPNKVDFLSVHFRSKKVVLIIQADTSCGKLASGLRGFDISLIFEDL